MKIVVACVLWLAITVSTSWWALPDNPNGLSIVMAFMLMILFAPIARMVYIQFKKES